MTRYRSSLIIALITIFSAAFVSDLTQAGADDVKPIKALLIAGGCCHDYANQQSAIAEGIQARANVQVDVYWTDNSSTSPILPLYQDPNWAAGYDVIIHDECAADIKDPALVDRIVQVHQKIPAVHLHCAMHSFRTGTDAWFRHLGLQSSGHGPQEPIDIQFVDPDHPITETLSDWTTIREELYNNVKILGAHSLAVGKQVVGQGDKARVESAVVAWTNETAGAKSFSTTIGHNTETTRDDRYLDLITRGLLWSCGKLSDEYLVPFDGENKTTFIDKTKVKMDLGQMPKDATLVKITTSSTQSGNEGFQIVDGKPKTRWCAAGGDYPQWVRLEFDEPKSIDAVRLMWEKKDGVYQYVVETSVDGSNWTTSIDQGKATDVVNGFQKLDEPTQAKFVRLTGLGGNAGWCSLWEIKLRGKDLSALWPADPDEEKFVPLAPDPYTQSGNTIPTIQPLTPEKEAEILRDVKVAEGFEATVFAAPPAVNYPVFVASSVDGTVFVSSDGNGSLGRDADRGRVIRLRDTDGDGRADETKVFCKVDAPRGLVWDHDRLYLMHPPHLSAFIDDDGDGVADRQEILVKNLAFGYDKRPADHTTNGVSLGVDGWLYIAGGDFGFIDAEGTDGTKLTHRGGGVIRVRPDGTGLQIYSTGTRNIMEVAISPAMEMFARDNTNDGGGWDVRLHHFTGMDDHGYPRLYKNFADECVAPLADYGGGSGCGAVYVDEPGFGVWNDSPMTADWGTGAIYRHTVKPNGATYQETEAPQAFIRMTRPTDADVDGNSRVYAASWRGATFNWNGPDVGYIVRVQPKGFEPAAMPNFEQASDDELAQLLDSTSYRRRVEAQRVLTRRGNVSDESLLSRIDDQRTSQRRLAARLQHDAPEQECIESLASIDPVIVHIAIRSLAQRGAAEACFQAFDESTDARIRQGVLRSLAMMHDAEVVEGLITRLNQSSDSQTTHAIAAALSRLHYREGKWNGDSWGTRPDTRGPYYQPEEWSETARIADCLAKLLDRSGGQETADLIETMKANRIQRDDSTQRLITLAQADPALIDPLVAHLKGLQEIPDAAMPILVEAVDRTTATPQARVALIETLARVTSAQATQAMIRAMARMPTDADPSSLQQAREAMLAAKHLDQHVSLIENIANDSPASSVPAQKTSEGFWADAALLAIASNPKSSPEASVAADLAIRSGWADPNRRVRLIGVAMHIDSHNLDPMIWAARRDSDATVGSIAASAIQTLGIVEPTIDQTPKVATLAMDEASTMAVAMKGDVSLGQRVFAKANCASCHTVGQDEKQKGPYLGNIAKTYKRPELATAILDPSKTIAQGFATNLILDYDGIVLTGFVTDEQSDRVTIRDAAAKETTIMKDDIEARQTSPTSVMPTGLMNDFTMHEFASLLDYLESIATK